MQFKPTQIRLYMVFILSHFSIVIVLTAVAFEAKQSARSLPRTPVWPREYIHTRPCVSMRCCNTIEVLNAEWEA